MVERQHQAASVMGFWVGPIVTNESPRCFMVPMPSHFTTPTSTKPCPLSLRPCFLYLTLLVNALFTDGCFNLSTPSGMNDLDIGTS